jgi:ketosteroid isomerase-like protein
VITDPLSFAGEWCRAWNARDLDGVLAHFHEDVVFTSPVARAVLPESDGTCTGKAALRAYWVRGLELIPDLHFTVEAVFAGTSTVVIQYRNQRGGQVCEVLVFEGDLVRYGHGTYLVEDGSPQPA